MAKILIRKILIIDDEVDITKVLSKQLQHAGFNVVVAYDGVQATKLAHQEKPDLIILDMMLPAGGGEGVLNNLRMSNQTGIIPIIILTGMDNEERLRKVEEIGIEALVKKPYEKDHLIAIIRDILNPKE